MALETLKGIKGIDGFKVICMDDLREEFPEKFTETGAMDYKWFESDIRPNHFIYIRHDKNSIAFTLQNGPVKEVGVNGCQVTALIAAAKIMVEGLNKIFPCMENEITITNLKDAIWWQERRTLNRQTRGVEGLNKE